MTAMLFNILEKTQKEGFRYPYKRLSVCLLHLDGTASFAYMDETVVLLSKGEIDSRNIQVELSLEDMDLSGFQSNVTYNQIKEWVKEQTGLSVSSLYIAQVKRKYGLAVGLNQNPAKAEGGRVPQCPPEKEAAIKAALEHFRLLPATRTEDA